MRKLFLNALPLLGVLGLVFLTGCDNDDDGILLRTHTSTIQIREMLRRKPPLAVVGPGAVFRRDDDATHSPMFFQIEGFVVDERVTFAHLKGVLTRFLQALFGSDASTASTLEMRPRYPSPDGTDSRNINPRCRSASVHVCGFWKSTPPGISICMDSAAGSQSA